MGFLIVLLYRLNRFLDFIKLNFSLKFLLIYYIFKRFCFYYLEKYLLKPFYLQSLDARNYFNHPKIEKIVYDVLIPSSSKLEGIYEYYGPSLEMFDALYIDKKKWNYQKDIDIKLDPNIKDFMWVNPKEE